MALPRKYRVLLQKYSGRVRGIAVWRVLLTALLQKCRVRLRKYRAILRKYNGKVRGIPVWVLHMRAHAHTM